MDYPEKIKTIEKFNQSSFKEKGSEFIAQVYSVQNVDEIVETLNKLKRKYYDATHHCYAYKLLNGKFKYSDDSEPAGSAGIRILNAIEHFDLTNQIVVVIRYFGGTKLGVGPLGKAYYKAAFDVLKTSNIIEKSSFLTVFISSTFDNISHLYRIISKHNSIIEESSYNDNVKLKCFVPISKINILFTELNEITKGEISIKKTDEKLYL